MDELWKNRREYRILLAVCCFLTLIVPLICDAGQRHFATAISGPPYGFLYYHPEFQQRIVRAFPLVKSVFAAGGSSLLIYAAIRCPARRCLPFALPGVAYDIFYYLSINPPGSIAKLPAPYQTAQKAQVALQLVQCIVSPLLCILLTQVFFRVVRQEAAAVALTMAAMLLLGWLALVPQTAIMRGLSTGGVASLGYPQMILYLLQKILPYQLSGQVGAYLIVRLTAGRMHRKPRAVGIP